MMNPFSSIAGLLGEVVIPDEPPCVDENGTPIPGVAHCCSGYVNDAGRCAEKPEPTSPWTYIGVGGLIALVAAGGYYTWDRWYR